MNPGEVTRWDTVAVHVTPQEEDAARRVLAGWAADADELRRWLDMLGLGDE